jgi:hypothetical protein
MSEEAEINLWTTYQPGKLEREKEAGKIKQEEANRSKSATATIS